MVTKQLKPYLEMAGEYSDVEVKDGNLYIKNLCGTGPLDAPTPAGPAASC